MNEVVVVGLLSLAGTLIGSVSGILVSNKLAMYRIEQLEKKVEKHNTVIERTAVLERDLKTAYNRIDDLKGELAEQRKERHEQ